MSKFTQSGSRFMVAKDEDAIIWDTLPVGTYTVEFSDTIGFYLTTINDFSLPVKIYGEAPQLAERILNTFDNRPGGTGVHLNGVKGSGKTLLAKSICIQGALRGIPTIVINHPYSGDEFNNFIQTIGCAIILFDEFEKTYNFENQTKVLTLFDGVYPSKKLFVITTNEAFRVSEFLQNRPGRMYYSLSYDTMDIAMVREYLEDTLNNKSKIDSIIKYAKVFTFLNFDMLTAIVEEMNRYNESLSDVLKVLNIKPEMKENELYKLSMKVGNYPLVPYTEIAQFDPNTFYRNVAYDFKTVISKLKSANDLAGLSTDTIDNFDFTDEDILLGDEDDCEFGPSDLVEFDSASVTFTFERQYKNIPILLIVTRKATLPSRSRIFNVDAF